MISSTVIRVWCMNKNDFGVIHVKNDNSIHVNKMLLKQIVHHKCYHRRIFHKYSRYWNNHILHIIPLNGPLIFHQVRFVLSVAVLANKFIAKGHSMAMETGSWRSVEMRQFHLVIDFPYPNALYNWWKIGIGSPYWSWEMEGLAETKRIGAGRVTDFRNYRFLIY